MSGIYGIFRFDGAPAESETLLKMRQAMAYYGPDGGGEWREGQVGLGQLLLRVTPEDRFESQPLAADGITLVAAARLDNRDELLREFRIPAVDHAATADSVLILEAYCKWGENCHEHLNGDWQFAAWNSRCRSIFIARDHHGNTGLYYHKNSRYIAFASSQKALLALPEVPHSPDMLKMAQVLTSWRGEGNRTAYEELHRLPPAHTMRITGQGVEIRRYWFPENLPTLHLSDDREYVEQFLDIYGEAVRCRLRSERPIGVTLSGGLDSGSVTALAAPLLAAAGKRLTAFTSVPAYEANVSSYHIGNEWPLATATARMAGRNIVHVPLRSEKVSIVSAIEKQLALHDGPGHAAANYYWVTDLLEQTRSRNIRTLLTGQEGNATVSFAGNGGLLQHLQRGDLRTAARVLRLAEPGVLLALKRQFLKPLLLPGIRMFRRNMKGGGTAWRRYSAISPDFAQELRLGERMAESGHDPTFTVSPNTRYQLAILLPAESSSGAQWHELGAWYGMEVCDPTVDKRVIEFCLRTPDDQFRRLGESRWLIRQAMAGRMPDEVLLNQRKGLQAADIGHRVRKERDEIDVVMRRIEGSTHGRHCLDIAAMRDALTSVDREVSTVTTLQCNAILLRGVGVGLFLSQF